MGIITDSIFKIADFIGKLGMRMYTYKEANAELLERNSGRQSLTERFADTRKFTEDLCKSFIAEDYVIQSMPDASPTKWHLAHTTWFFERFILNTYIKNYSFYDSAYNFLFNS